MTDLPTALLVDDTPDIRMLVRMTLEATPLARVVAEAGNGLQGVEAAAEHRPELIMLDLAMPVMDGLEALPRLRRICPDATIIVMSGFEVGAMRADVFRAGADGYLQKGISPSRIESYVADKIRERRARVVAPVAPVQVGVPLDLAAGLEVLALQASPFGVIACSSATAAEGEAAPRVEFINTTAARRLGCDPSAADLASCSPALAGALEREAARLDGGEQGTATIAGKDGVLDVVFVPVADRVLIYLASYQAHDEDAALLRRAIGVAAHEVRNPVSVLVGVADAFTVLGGQMDEAQRLQMLEAVRRQAIVLDRLTQDLLTTSQMHHGSLRLEPQEVLLSEVVKEIASAHLGDVDYDVECPDNLEVYADPIRLEQVVTNLITNAVKYGEPRFELRARAEGSFAVLEVTDHGRGVPTDFEADLFGEFRRAAGTRARGTGLGLWVVRSLAEAHGGSATYRRSPAGGATFVLSLPLAR